MMENNILGEAGQGVTTIEGEYENSSAGIGIDESKYSPEFYLENPLHTMQITHCKTCGNKTTDVSTIDGECIVCALKRMRKLETRLAELNQIKQEHTYCAIEGHNVAYENKLFPDWAGKFVINGIELYPVFPLCKDCLDILSAYFVYLFEERGILRRGSGHIKNKFSTPYNVPLSKVERVENTQKLTDFINAAKFYALDQENPMHELFKELKERRKLLISNEQKGIKEWQKEKGVKLPTNQLEFLKLAEKYYPCLKNDTDAQRQKSKEIEWLKQQPIPEIVITKIVKLLEEMLKTYNLPQLLGKADLEQQKLNKQLVKDLLNKNPNLTGKDVENIMEFLLQTVSLELGPLADSAEEVLEQALQRVTWSNLILESTTDELKPEK